MKLIVLYLLIVNAVGFILMLVDKYKARKNLWRIPEATLMLVAAIGGSVGFPLLDKAALRLHHLMGAGTVKAHLAVGGDGILALVAVAQRLIGTDDLLHLHAAAAQAGQGVLHPLALGAKLLGVVHVTEVAAAALAGYTPMDICLSFRNTRGWKDTTVEKIQNLADIISPRFIEKARETGLIPKEAEEESSMPNLDVTTVGGVPPWEQKEYQSNATDSLK